MHCWLLEEFAGNFAPSGWATCAGQAVAIAENEALFTLFGITYGGDGWTTFNLPDLQGRLPIHQGQSSGTSNRVIGEAGGTETETLTVSQLPVHSHALQCNSGPGNARTPANHLPANEATGQTAIYNRNDPDVMMNAGAILGTGGDQPHENMPPFLVVTFILSPGGIYPT